MLCFKVLWQFGKMFVNLVDFNFFNKEFKVVLMIFIVGLICFFNVFLDSYISYLIKIKLKKSILNGFLQNIFRDDDGDYSDEDSEVYLVDCLMYVCLFLFW